MEKLEKVPAKISPQEQSIIDEATNLLKNNPAKWQIYLNNFYTRVIPVDNERVISFRENLQKYGYWDKKRKNYIEEDKRINHSDLWLNQTPKEFFKTIDDVIEELDTNGEIKKAIKEYCDIKKDREIAQEILEEKLIPVFARLITMGYKKFDLTG